jgi:hypothetical protein
MDVDSAIFDFLKQFEQIESASESYSQLSWDELIRTFEVIFEDDTVLSAPDEIHLREQMVAYLLQHTPEEHKVAFQRDEMRTAILLFRCAQANRPEAFMAKWDQLDPDTQRVLTPQAHAPSIESSAIRSTIENYAQFLIARTRRLQELRDLGAQIDGVRLDLEASKELSIEEILSDTKAMSKQHGDLEREIADLERSTQRGPGSEADLLAEQAALREQIAALEPEVQSLSARVSNLDELRRLETAKTAERGALGEAAARAKALEDRASEIAKTCTATEEALASARQRLRQLESCVAERGVALRAARTDGEFRGKSEIISRLKADRARLRQQIEAIKARAPHGKS